MTRLTLSLLLLAGCSKSSTLLATPDGGEDGGSPDDAGVHDSGSPGDGGGGGTDGGGPCTGGLRLAGAPLRIDRVSLRRPPSLVAGPDGRIDLFVEDDVVLHDSFEAGIVVTRDGELEQRFSPSITGLRSYMYPGFEDDDSRGVIGVFADGGEVVALSDGYDVARETSDVVIHVVPGTAGAPFDNDVIELGGEVRGDALVSGGDVYIAAMLGPEHDVLDGRGLFGNLVVFRSPVHVPIGMTRPSFLIDVQADPIGGGDEVRQPRLAAAPDGTVFIGYLTRIDWPWALSIQRVDAVPPFPQGGMCGLIDYDFVVLENQVITVEACPDSVILHGFHPDTSLEAGRLTLDSRLGADPHPRIDAGFGHVAAVTWRGSARTPVLRVWPSDRAVGDLRLVAVELPRVGHPGPPVAVDVAVIDEATVAVVSAYGQQTEGGTFHDDAVFLTRYAFCD